MYEAQVIKVIFDLVDGNTRDQADPQEYRVSVNHTGYFTEMLNTCKVPIRSRQSVVEILQQLRRPHTWVQTRTRLQQAGITRESLDMLQALEISIPLRNRDEFDMKSPYMKDILALGTNLDMLGLGFRASFDPLLVSNFPYQGLVFQVIKKMPGRSGNIF